MAFKRFANGLHVQIFIIISPTIPEQNISSFSVSGNNVSCTLPKNILLVLRDDTLTPPPVRGQKIRCRLPSLAKMYLYIVSTEIHGL